MECEQGQSFTTKLKGLQKHAHIAAGYSVQEKHSSPNYKITNPLNVNEENPPTWMPPYFPTFGCAPATDKTGNPPFLPNVGRVGGQNCEEVELHQ